MLITSRTMKGQCIICGAERCACGGPSNSVPVDERVTKAESGPLREYQLRPGLFVQLTEAEAERRGLIGKERERPENKMRTPGENKARG